MVKVVHLPTSLVTEMYPPNRSVIPRQMARPSPVPLPGGFGTEKRSKDFGQLVFGDTAPRVFNRDLDGTVLCFRGYGHRAVLFDCLDCVEEEIEDNLAHERRIGIDPGQISTQSPYDADVLCPGFPFRPSPSCSL